MSRKSQRAKANKKQFLSQIKKQIIRFIRNCFTFWRRTEAANAGFVLPTVAMVSLVVVLLTTAIMFRSFERSKNASNVRVNEAVLNAAAPAIDRAKAKLNKLFADSRLPRATPTDTTLKNAFETYLNEYTLGDEIQLELTNNSDHLRSAWMFPIDTDNNGSFDSYTLYGIYFQNPPVSNGIYTRARNSLEARTPPMTGGGVGGNCGDIIGTSATLVGNSGWFKIGNKLKKSFFVYTATVPITNTGTLPTGYERYNGNKGFSALEYQQERVQLPLVNNAVVYEDDLEITPGPKLNLNGRILTNSNLFTGSGFERVTLYQVSSPNSCFYEDENAKILVGGNVGAGTFTSSSDLSNGTALHLFQGKENNPTIITNDSDNLKANKSVTQSSSTIAYNSLAYAQRINRLVDAQMTADTTGNTDPQEVQNGPATKTRRERLELYFQKRTRRVPYAEVSFGGNALVSGGTNYATTSPFQNGSSGDTLRPIDYWVFPFNPSNGTNKTNYANLDLNISSNKLLPSATEPKKLEKIDEGKERYVGDRVLIGNNLPELWWDSNKGRFVGSGKEDTQEISSYYWNNPENTNSDNIRTRRSRIEQLADLGATERNGEWELAAAKIPSTPQDPVGGLRVVTGAGIYLPDNATATTTNFSSYSTQIWSDLMPAKYDTVPAPIKPFELYSLDIQYSVPQPPVNTPYLRMRATAVYHYKGTSYNETTPTPIACVSSYYDPTNSTTAKNISTWNNATGGKSNNGIVYGPPTASVSTYRNLLNYQAQLTYPNGRLVNEPLQKALAKLDASATLSLSDQSAIHSALCAIEIMVAKTPDNTVIPHGAIRETAFLDARQIKAIDATTGSRNYDLAKKDREPLEIRATVLDINLLRTKAIGTGSTSTQEYLLPNSGIIYATRDDALPDQSAGTSAAAQLESPVDFKLDPTRRPNGIMLVNGSQLFRGTTNTYRDAEKGLILASNLPVYIKGNFNLHTQQEFTTALADDWSNFYTRTAANLNPNFACRPGDPRLPNCTTGDEWRSAAVLADAVTLLSNNFREGFRNEGDYDWKPVASTIPSALSDGFSTVNSFVPQFRWYGSNGMPQDLVPDVTGTPETQGFQASSYLNNFVTPVMKWVPVPELATEVCVPNSTSGGGNSNGSGGNGNGNGNGNRNSTTTPTTPTTPTIPTTPAIPTTPTTPTGCRWTVTTSNSANGQGNTYPEGHPGNSIKTGTLAREPEATYANMPRRVAFVRDSNGNLVKDVNNNPQVYGIEDVSNPPSGRTKIFSVTNNSPFAATGNVRVDTTKFIPLLELLESSGNISYKPILQIDKPFTTHTNLNPSSNTLNVGRHGNWLPVATETTFNVIIAAGDTPARSTEDNGGLHNFPRFLENWNPTGTVSDAIKARISGSFMQIKRSEYATAPYMVFPSGNDMKYAMDANASGRIPYYLAPTRQWGYDVALLSQSPDLFAQKLVRIPDDSPDEFFREVGRDDAWVKTLLCAKDSDNTYVIDADQRPDSCQS